jgi:pilus assembly protein CpaD
MDMRMNSLHVISIAAMLFAGSCAAPENDVSDPGVFADGAANHPISVSPGYRSVKLAFAGPSGKLSPDDEARLATFVSDYLARGNGSLSVTASRGPESSEAIEFFTSRLRRMGVPRSSLLVGTRDSGSGDSRVEIGYVSYVAHTDPCGDWSHDADDTADNLPMPDFGCAVQHNVAAMVADPRDLVSPREMTPADAARRATLVKQYETGQITSAQKTQEQSGAVSQVTTGGP